MNLMDEILPPPPPPPLPPSLPFQELKLNSQAIKGKDFCDVHENDLDFALERLLSNDVEFDKIFYKCNTYCMPQLQDGPKCGLVALSIATSVLKTFVDVEKIFKTAVSLKLTNRGEMFSVNFLAFLAEKCCSFKTRIIEGGLSAHLDCILKCLMKKDLLLVPYDADFNHSPCCKKGSKAHWALITGFVITERKQTNLDKGDNNFVVLNSSESFALCKCMGSSGDLNLDLSIDWGKITIRKTASKGIGEWSEGKVYLMGRQGKSRHMGLWLFDEMAKSNDNLVFFPPEKDFDYVLPEGGLLEGLKGRAIILNYSKSG